MQIYSNFELIVIDDGSNDSTLDVIKNIQDSRLKVFPYPVPVVQPSVVTVDFPFWWVYCFLDADDLWTPDKLEAQLAALQENPPAVAYSWVDRIDESSHFTSWQPCHCVWDVHAVLHFWTMVPTL